MQAPSRCRPLSTLRFKIENRSPEARRYRSLILALKEEDFAAFLSDLEIFVKQTLSKFDSDQFAERKLFQMNFNLHSVSEKQVTIK